MWVIVRTTNNWAWPVVGYCILGHLHLIFSGVFYAFPEFVAFRVGGNSVKLETCVKKISANKAMTCSVFVLLFQLFLHSGA